MAEKKDFWSIWYNTDRPWAGTGDFENVGRIENLYDKVCRRGYSIASAQCRDLDSHVTFDATSTNYPRLNLLSTPCTSEGIECVNGLQTTADGRTHMCPDYAIRFRCTYTGVDDDDQGLFPQFDVRIYIILAVFPILIFLARILWAYVFRRRRQRRREARRLARLARARGSQGEYGPDDDDTSSIASELANPPPTYHQLFGDRDPSSVFTICRGNVPVCNKCATTPCSVAFILKDTDNSNPLSVREGGTSESVAPPRQTENQGLSQLPGTNTSSRGDASGENNNTTTDPVGSSENNHHRVVHAVHSTSTVDSYLDTGTVCSRENSVNGAEDSSGVVSPTSSVPSIGGTHPVDSNHIELQERIPQPIPDNVISTTEPDTSSSVLSQPQQPPLFSPLDSTILEPSRISQPCACVCHRTIPSEGQVVSGCNNPGFVIDDEMAQSSRFPGMHTHVPGIPRVLSNVSLTSTITLSELPSYEDALELMKKKESEAANEQQQQEQPQEEQEEQPPPPPPQQQQQPQQHTQPSSLQQEHQEEKEQQ